MTRKGNLAMILVLFVGMVGCTKPDPEVGYRHLMKVLHQRRSLHTCEQYYDGETCMTIEGKTLCGDSRDGEAEAAAEWIENHYPVEPCSGCEAKP